MPYQRELWWWLGACAAGLGVTALAGGIIGPEVALFALVALAGWLLIRYEGLSPAPGPGHPFETGGETLDYSEPRPAAVGTVAGEPDPEALVVEDSTVDEPVVEDSTVDEPVVEDSTVDEPVVEDSTVDEPVVEERSDEDPAAASDVDAVDGTPVVDEPAAERAGSG